MAALALLGAGSLAGCTSLGDQELFPKLDVPDTGGSGCSSDPLPADLAKLVEAKCGAGCHTGGAALGGFDFDPATAAKWINAKSLTGAIMVIPGDAANSYLMKKMEGTGSGLIMPTSGKLSADELKLFSDWIAALPPCSTGPTDEPDTAGGDDASGEVVQSGDGTGPGPDVVVDPCPVPQAVADLLNSSCAGCHVGGATLGGYDCDPARVIATNVNVASTTTGTLLIDPGKPDSSYMFMKVDGKGVGSEMPLGGSLTPQQKQTLRDWITSLSKCGGAP